MAGGFFTLPVVYCRSLWEETSDLYCLHLAFKSTGGRRVFDTESIDFGWSVSLNQSMGFCGAELEM